MGIGNGMIISYEGVLLQTVVPDNLLGRFFGIKNSIVSWCFAVAFLSGGALTAAIGPRAVFAIAGVGTLAMCGYGSLQASDGLGRSRPRPDRRRRSGASPPRRPKPSSVSAMRRCAENA